MILTKDKIVASLLIFPEMDPSTIGALKVHIETFLQKQKLLHQHQVE